MGAFVEETSQAVVDGAELLLEVDDWSDERRVMALAAAIAFEINMRDLSQKEINHTVRRVSLAIKNFVKIYRDIDKEMEKEGLTLSNSRGKKRGPEPPHIIPRPRRRA